MTNVQDDLIDGTEYIKFMADSTPHLEHEYNIVFSKGNKREIKTLAGYINRIKEPINIKQISWNSFKVYTDKEILFECELADDKYVSDRFEETAIEAHKRIYKVKDISELIQYLMISCVNLNLVETKNENFSINDWIIEQRLVPHEILHRRILQVISYCKYKHIRNILPYENLTTYILDYLQMLLRRKLRHPEIQFNFITDLRIFKYLKQEEFLDFKITLNKVIGMLLRKETIIHYWIEKLQEDYDKFEDKLLAYVNRRINNG